LGKTDLIPSTGLRLGDNSLVSFGLPDASGVATFSDHGFMPITASNTSFGGLYIAYTAGGTQHFSPSGQPTTADYSTMHYQLMAYVGKATFGHGAGGEPTISGIIAKAEVGHGDLIAGHLAMRPDGSIAGTLKAGIDFGAKHVGSLDINVAHFAGDMRPVGPGAFTLDGGSSSALFHIG